MNHYREALATWKHLVKLHNERELLSLDLLAHPEATTSDIERVRLGLIDGRTNMREGYKQMVAAHNKSREVSWVAPVKPAFMEKR